MQAPSTRHMIKNYDMGTRKQVMNKESLSEENKILRDQLGQLYWFLNQSRIQNDLLK